MTLRTNSVVNTYVGSDVCKTSKTCSRVVEWRSIALFVFDVVFQNRSLITVPLLDFYLATCLSKSWSQILMDASLQRIKQPNLEGGGVVRFNPFS